MHLHWSRCPHCGVTIHFQMRGGGPWDSKLGEPTILMCQKCGGKYTDGKLEWDDMNPVQKLREIAWYSVVSFIVAPLLSLLLAALVAGLLNWLTDIDFAKDNILFFLGFACIVLIFFWYSFITNFSDSKKRTRNKNPNCVL